MLRRIWRRDDGCRHHAHGHRGATNRHFAEHVNGESVARIVDCNDSYFTSGCAKQPFSDVVATIDSQQVQQPQARKTRKRETQQRG